MSYVLLHHANKRPVDQDLQVLYTTAARAATPSEAALLKELYALGHYPCRTSKRKKTVAEKNEDDFAKRISKRYQDLGPECRAYVDAVAAIKHEDLNESHDESQQESAPQVVTVQDTRNPTPRGVELLFASALQGAPGWEQNC